MRRRVLESMLPGERMRRFGRLLLMSLVVGVIAGLGAVVFHYLLEAVSWLALDGLAGFDPGRPGGEAGIFPPFDTPFRRWVLLLLPAAGGLLAGWLVFTFAPEAEGHGTDAVIEAYHRKAGEIRARVPVIKTIASAITIGTGGSGGREGPIAQIGAGFGSIFARVLKLAPRDRALLVACGMGAGIGSIFHAPLAGALFAAEVLYREIDFEFEVIVPATVASIIGYATSAFWLGWDPLFRTSETPFRNPVELVGYLLLAGILALAAGIFVRVFYGTRDRFRALRVPDWSKPVIGGLLTGIVGWFFPDALATGYGVVQSALDGTAAPAFLLAAAVLRIVTTSTSIASGGSGGVFGPSVVVGASLGGAVGGVLHRVAPVLAPEPSTYALVGMAAFFAAAANTPLSSVIIVSEMTGNYYLLVPAMWTSAIAFALSHRSSLYEKQAANRADTPVHSGEMALEVLRRLRVADHMAGEVELRRRMVGPGTSFDELVRRFSETGAGTFLVVDDDGRLLGCVTDAQLRVAIPDREVAPLLVAQDLAVLPETVVPTDTLDVAVRRMIRSGLGELVVVDPVDRSRPVGVISRAQVMAAYDREVLRAENWVATP